MLSQTVMEFLYSRAGRLEKNEEHEFSDDSDYESEEELQDGSVTGEAGADHGECFDDSDYESEEELQDGSVTGEAGVDHGENWEQKLLPVLKVGSWTA